MSSADEIIDILPSPPKKDTDLIIRAYNFALRAHEGQFRKSGDPYFTHVFKTGKYLAELGMSPTVISAGFLHDVLEDTPTTEKELEKEFGKEIVSLVKSVTKLGTVKYKGVERNVENLRKFFVSMAEDFRVIIIKLCDRLHNVETLGFVNEDKQRRIALETLEIYAPLANRLSLGKLRGRLEDAAFPYAFKNEYEETKKILSERKELDEKHLHIFEKELEKKLNDEKIKFISIDHRIKHLYSLWTKLKRYEGEISKIHDVIALRVTVKTVEECYGVLGAIHSIWKPLPGRIKDYIALPKSNGYRSLHTTVLTGTGGIVEVQIRTEEMHIEAEYGIAAHFAYKEKIKLDKKDLKKEYEWIQELQKFQKGEADVDTFLENLKYDFFKHRVFVFTPKGDVIDLPEGATVIDFAYHVHSELGDHAQGAKINGRFSPIDTVLKNADICEITVNKKSVPSQKWLDFAITTMARSRIQKYFKKESLVDKFKKYLKQ
jgi:guanosine-3',5'-bis(diphosphate) 3'-pyrophosphohydrolase